MELASTIASAWLQRSLIAPPVEAVELEKVDELSERKSSGPPSLPPSVTSAKAAFADSETIEGSHLSERPCEYGLVASGRLRLGRGEEEKEEEEEERCDEDDSADDADEAVDCSCSGSATACASSARAFDARKKSTAAMSRLLSSVIRRRRMAKERSLFPLSLSVDLFSTSQFSFLFLCSTSLADLPPTLPPFFLLHPPAPISAPDTSASSLLC